MSLPATPATPAAHGLGHNDAQGHRHTHGHHHGHDHGHHHGHGSDAPPPQPGGLPNPPSLLMAGATTRLAGVVGLLLLLWAAVAWALGEPA
ncbi:MAG: hypothetical protein QE285_04595 [Aquabacterium sp.]|nr:hypothetical protein [Aquabacterium sp.]